VIGQSLGSLGHVQIGGQHDDGDLGQRFCGPHHFEQLEAGDVRQVNVQQDQAGPDGGQPLQGFIAAPDDLGGVAGLRHDCLVDVA
jgi:hypothetical protein